MRKNIIENIIFSFQTKVPVLQAYLLVIQAEPLEQDILLEFLYLAQS